MKFLDELGINWISVKDRLPQSNIYVLTFHEDGWIESDRLCWDRNLEKLDWFESTGKVTYWMPLPEPPK